MKLAHKQLVAANFLAAFGSGWFLATGLELAPLHREAWGDSILAFLIGSSLSVFITIYKKNHGIHFPTHLLSGLAAFATLPLVLAATLIPGLRQILLFHPLSCLSILSFFFCCSFLARTERIAASTKVEHLIFPVEFAYAAGATVSLIVASNISGMTPGTALTIGAVVYSLAWILDYTNDFQNQPTERSESSLTSNPTLEFLPLAVELSALTIGTQVVSQMISQSSKNPAPLAAFDFGAMLAPLLCTYLGFRFSGDCFERKSFRLDASTASKLTLTLMVISALIFILFVGNKIGRTLGLGIIFVASSAYEIICLLRFQAIGETDSGRETIPVIFSIMAVSATLTYFLFLVGRWELRGIVAILVVLLGVLKLGELFLRRPTEKLEVD